MNIARDASIVLLTGAGVSAESGMRTFRDAGGLWEGHRVEDVATPEGFARDPDLVHAFYNARRRQLAEVAPNAAHFALAKLEHHWPGEVLLVTQNVDDLHERAGSQNLIHLHGELLKARCGNCGSTRSWMEDLDRVTPCPACGAEAMRPHIVWFGEMPFELPRIYGALERCGLFLAIGTSGLVYPAAGFVAAAERAWTVELNLERSEVAGAFRDLRAGPATETVPTFVAALLEA
ncbi:MAG TPA: NAD-dependent deacylase [Holophagaceae bacterium]|jgi:NAD-dependent deacetylase|nr:NAD-dependent deacylase [Holophagaceae bacterium]